MTSLEEKLIGVAAFALLWIATLFVVGAWQRHEGRQLEQTAWLQKEADAQKAYEALRQQYAALEQDSAGRISTIGNDLQKERNQREQVQRILDARIRSGAVGVRVAVSECTPASGAEARTDPGQPATATARLLPATTADLVRLATDADDTANDLNACIAVAAEDRRLINGKATAEIP